MTGESRQKKIQEFAKEFFTAVILGVEEHCGIKIDEGTLHDLETSFFATYFPPLGHGLLGMLCARPDLDPKEHADEIFTRMLALGELEETTDKETKKISPMTPAEKIRAVVKACFEGPYHSVFLQDLTATEDWYGQSWIVGRMLTLDDERKFAEKLSRSMIDAKSLLDEWRKIPWEQKGPVVSDQKPTTGQYL